MLHGHDLDKWHYIGFIELSLDKSDHPVFLFINKDDYTKRSYTITGYNPDLVRKYHTYVTKHLEPWTKGEYEIYTLCEHPARWLNEYMLDTFSCIWDKETNWWVSNDKAKYDSAQKKQTCTKKTPPNLGSADQKDPVVVQVDFGKKKDES